MTTIMYTNESDAAEFRKSQDEKRADVSQDNPRDIVEVIDALIMIRIRRALDGALPGDDDIIELAKRRITDYLLVADPRAGVFIKP